MYPCARSNLRLMDTNGHLDVFSFILTIESSHTIHCNQGVSYPRYSPLAKFHPSPPSINIYIYYEVLGVQVGSCLFPANHIYCQLSPMT